MDTFDVAHRSGAAAAPQQRRHRPDHPGGLPEAGHPHGFEDGLFAAWRKDPEFVLNQPQYARATVLVAGPEFGTGSSREHAVWALQDYGFRVVISPSLRRHLPRQQRSRAVCSPCSSTRRSSSGSGRSPSPTRTPRSPSTCGPGRCASPATAVPFEIDEYARWRLLEGLDDIGLTLRHAETIARTRHAGRAGCPPRVAG